MCSYYSSKKGHRNKWHLELLALKLLQEKQLKRCHNVVLGSTIASAHKFLRVHPLNTLRRHMTSFERRYDVVSTLKRRHVSTGEDVN